MMLTRVLDIGACQLIIDGKIKIKGAQVSHFSTDRIVFKDGSDLDADVVILATGWRILFILFQNYY